MIEMITCTHGNIFDADVDVIINPVNCVGVMGKGLALQFKRRFPDMYKQYRYDCQHHAYEPGAIHMWNESTPRIMTFATKGLWQYPSQLAWIDIGLRSINDRYKGMNINSIAIPPLGCGNGGLEWKVVKSVIEHILCDVDMDIILYEPKKGR
jgi:O-acetyl-ADP-ribose deacetylase (regulator of RNase III)